MRLLFPLLSLAIAGLSLEGDYHPHVPDSRMCLEGGCRFDQLDAIVLAQGATPAAAKALLAEDSSDPAMWCAYGEFLSIRGNSEKARCAFAQALTLGPGMSAVLMRIVNFDFAYSHEKEGLRLIPRILLQTGEFDELIFSYARAARIPISDFLNSLIPPTPRLAISWLDWQLRVGTDQDVLDSWAWVRKHKLADEKLALEIVDTLWQRKAYRTAQQMWVDWIDAGDPNPGNVQLLSNRRFESVPSGAPFDWKLSPGTSVSFSRRDGLDVRFWGRENVSDAGVQQSTVLKAGRYKFSAEVSADNVTTDQGLFFRISDVETPGRLTLETQTIMGTASRSWITVEFTVISTTCALDVRLLRHASQKFDNKITGRFHIYQVSLIPVSRTPERFESTWPASTQDRFTGIGDRTLAAQVISLGSSVDESRTPQAR